MTLDEWILYGRTGGSSKAIWGAVKGVARGGGSIPHDVSDFSRCYDLVKNCNLDKKHLEQVKTVFPHWQPFIESWDTLTSLYEENTEESYEKCYNLIKYLVLRSKKISYRY